MATHLKALVFMTNPDSVRALSANPYVLSRSVPVEFTTARLLYFMTAEGGFDDGQRKGGPSQSYWVRNYLATRLRDGQKLDPRITKAILLSYLIPASTDFDRNGAREIDSWIQHAGVATPIYPLWLQAENSSTLRRLRMERSNKAPLSNTQRIKLSRGIVAGRLKKSSRTHKCAIRFGRHCKSVGRQEHFDDAFGQLLASLEA